MNTLSYRRKLDGKCLTVLVADATEDTKPADPVTPSQDAATVTRPQPRSEPESGTAVKTDKDDSVKEGIDGNLSLAGRVGSAETVSPTARATAGAAAVGFSSARAAAAAYTPAGAAAAAYTSSAQNGGSSYNSYGSTPSEPFSIRTYYHTPSVPVLSGAPYFNVSVPPPGPSVPLPIISR